MIDLQTAHLLSGMQTATSSLVGSIKDGSVIIGAGVGGGLNAIGWGLGVGLIAIGIGIGLRKPRQAPRALCEYAKIQHLNTRSSFFCIIVGIHDMADYQRFRNIAPIQSTDS